MNNSILVEQFCTQGSLPAVKGFRYLHIHVLWGSMFLLTLPGLYHYCLVIKARADGWNYLGKAEEYHSRERRKLIQPYFQTALDDIYTVASFVITKQKTQPTTQTNKNNNKRKYEWLVKNLETTEKAWKLKFWWIFPFSHLHALPVINLSEDLGSHFFHVLV